MGSHISRRGKDLGLHPEALVAAVAAAAEVAGAQTSQRMAGILVWLA